MKHWQVYVTHMHIYIENSRLNNINNVAIFYFVILEITSNGFISIGCNEGVFVLLYFYLCI